jgi:hypothetical protein
VTMPVPYMGEGALLSAAAKNRSLVKTLNYCRQVLSVLVRQSMPPHARGGVTLLLPSNGGCAGHTQVLSQNALGRHAGGPPECCHKVLTGTREPPERINYFVQYLACSRRWHEA